MTVKSVKKSRKLRLLSFAIIAAVIFVAPLMGMVGAITNGQPDGNKHPYVCVVVFYANGTLLSIASGTLISETVVLTAGHGTFGAESARVYFDSKLTSPPFPSDGGINGTPETHPDYRLGFNAGLPGAITHDVGVIVLDTPVPTDKGLGQLPDLGLADTLPMKTGVDLVGYGAQTMVRGGGKPYWIGEMARYYAQAEIIKANFVISDEFLKITSNAAGGKGGTAFGDSGGPVLLAGTNIILAVTSYGTNYQCEGIGYYCRIDTASILDWVNNVLNQT